MPTHNVVLSDEHEALIAELVQSGEFRDAGEVMSEGLRLVEAIRKGDAAKQEEWRTAVQAGIDDLENCRFTTLSGADEIAGHVRSLGQEAAGMVAASDSLRRA